MLSKLEYTKHRITETQLQARIVRAEWEASSIGNQILLATLESRETGPGSLPVRGRDNVEESEDAAVSVHAFGPRSRELPLMCTLSCSPRRLSMT